MAVGDAAANPVLTELLASISGGGVYVLGGTDYGLLESTSGGWAAGNSGTVSGGNEVPAYHAP